MLLKRRMMMSKKLLMELIILENLFLLFLHLILSEVDKIHLQYIYLGFFLINIKYEPIYRTLNKQTNKQNFLYIIINRKNIILSVRNNNVFTFFFFIMLHLQKSMNYNKYYHKFKILKDHVLLNKD